MSNKYSFSLSDKTEFVQAITIDINGISRGKMFPIEKLESLLEGKEEVIGLLELLGSKSEIPITIEDITNNHYENELLVPDKSTLRQSPWSEDSTLAMFFYDTYDRQKNIPWPFNPRLAAKTKIKELEEMGYKLFIGVENEFRLFDEKTRKPLLEERNFVDQLTQATVVLPFMSKLKKSLKQIDIEFDSCNMEYGISQIEIPLRVYSGIDAVDKIWFFKEVSKHVAHKMGMIASFMSVPLANDVGNGMHINHSLWQDTESGLHNVMWASSDKDELSQTGKYWLAGLLTHTKALCAFYYPTVNCYRRIAMAAWSPNNISWNYRDRSASMRLKTSWKHEQMNYIENRMPSSACNIYIAIAGMIVAGMDGIRNKLPLIEPGNGPHCETLPKSLAEALDELRKDKVIVEGLGEKFVDWFVKVKTECDVDVLKFVDIYNQTEEELSKEFNKYIFL